MGIHLKTAQQGPAVEFTVDNTIAGHLLHDAARDLHEAYKELTKAMHTYAETETSGEEFDGRFVEILGGSVRNAGRRLEQIGRRIQVTKDGEQYGNLVDRTELGPQDDGSFKKVFISNDTSRGKVTHVFEVETGLSIYAGRNKGDESKDEPWDQPFVAIVTDDLKEHFCYGPDNGLPKLVVNIGDLEVFDDEGQGNKKQAPIDKE